MKGTSQFDRVRNPQGRVDWLAAKLFERLMERETNPVARLVYQEFKPQIETGLKAACGPRTKRGKQARAAILRLQQILAEQRRVA